MIVRLLYTCGLFLLPFASNALAQDPTGPRPDPEKKFRIFNGSGVTLFMHALPASRDCVDGKFEVVVRNGVAAISMKEVEIGSAPNAVKWHSGAEKAEFILGTGTCRVSIRAVPAD